MGWKAKVENALYLNFAVNKDEIDRLLPPGTSVDSRLYRGEPWGFFSLVLFRNRSIHHDTIPWPSFEFSQANLRIYVKDTDGTPSVYFKRLYLPGFYASISSWYSGLPVKQMVLNFPSKVNRGGKYRWRLFGNGEGNIVGKIGETSGVSGNLTNLFESEEGLVDYFRERPYAYFSAGMDYVYRINAKADYDSYFPFQVHEWELGFTADDLERHNFPEALPGNFCCPEMTFQFGSAEKVNLNELTDI